MDNDLGPTLAQLARVELVPDRPFDPHQATPGILDRRVLIQAEVWVDARAVVHRLEDMGDGYRANVAAHLHLHATWMWAAAAFDELLDNPLGVHTAHREAGIPLVGEVDPHAWLESTTLVRALRRLSPGIAPAPVLTAWAQGVSARSARAGTDIWKVPGSVVPMPQDPSRNWAQEMRQAPPSTEPDEERRPRRDQGGDHG